MKKQYYSAIKPYTTRKRLRLGYYIVRGIIRLFFPKNEMIWTCGEPEDNEPRFFVSNHTRIYAPIYFITCYPKKIRVWSNYYFLTLKDVWGHMFHKVLINLKYKWILYPLAFLLLPVVVMAFRCIEPIPTYHFGKKVYTTFDKSIQTYDEGIDQVIFPERTENQINDYIYELNSGFPVVAEECYKKTGKIMKFYPTYTCQSLRKILVGKPISYDPEKPMKAQRKEICRYLEGQIEALAKSLPKHDIVLYG